MTILELSGFFVPIKRVCSRSFTAYRGNIVGRHRLFDSPRRPEAADRISNRIHSILWGIGSHKLACADDNGRRRLGLSCFGLGSRGEFFCNGICYGSSHSRG
jgi:hypothetical protein